VTILPELALEQVVSQRAQLLGPSFGDDVFGDLRALNAGPGISAVLSKTKETSAKLMGQLGRRSDEPVAW
jgi:hypothetical protein